MTTRWQESHCGGVLVGLARDLPSGLSANAVHRELSSLRTCEVLGIPADHWMLMQLGAGEAALCGSLVHCPVWLGPGHFQVICTK